MPLGTKAAVRDSSGDTVRVLSSSPTGPAASNQVRFTTKGDIKPTAVQNAGKRRMGVTYNGSAGGGKAPTTKVILNDRQPVTPNDGAGGGKAPGRKAY